MEGRKNSDVFSVWKIHVRIGQEKPERESTMKNLQEDIQNQNFKKLLVIIWYLMTLFFKYCINANKISLF